MEPVACVIEGRRFVLRLRGGSLHLEGAEDDQPLIDWLEAHAHSRPILLDLLRSEEPIEHPFVAAWPVQPGIYRVSDGQRAVELPRDTLIALYCRYQDERRAMTWPWMFGGLQQGEPAPGEQAREPSVEDREACASWLADRARLLAQWLERWQLPALQRLVRLWAARGLRPAALELFDPPPDQLLLQRAEQALAQSELQGPSGVFERDGLRLGWWRSPREGVLVAWIGQPRSPLPRAVPLVGEPAPCETEWRAISRRLEIAWPSLLDPQRARVGEGTTALHAAEPLRARPARAVEPRAVPPLQTRLAAGPRLVAWPRAPRPRSTRPLRGGGRNHRSVYAIGPGSKR